MYVGQPGDVEPEAVAETEVLAAQSSHIDPLLKNAAHGDGRLPAGHDFAARLREQRELGAHSRRGGCAGRSRNQRKKKIRPHEADRAEDIERSAATS